jgi:hypothetical protein
MDTSSLNVAAVVAGLAVETYWRRLASCQFPLKRGALNGLSINNRRGIINRDDGFVMAF